MRVARLALGPLGTNCWVVGDDLGGPVAIIDPADEPQVIHEAVGDRDIALIVLTHGHFDHLGAARELVETSGAPLAVHLLDAENVTTAEGTGGLPFGYDVTAPRPSRVLADDEVFSAGDLWFAVLHTPGHTPGGICLLVTDGAGPAHLFSGDTLFAGSVGRTDLPGGDARALSRSIAQKLAVLDASTLVHPGHGPDTTIGHESKVNMFWPKGR